MGKMRSYCENKRKRAFATQKSQCGLRDLRMILPKWLLSTRLVTRTKESTHYASVRVSKPESRKETEYKMWEVTLATSTSPDPLEKGLSKSIIGRTRKMVNYTWVGRSQRKRWWKVVALLTCKSFVKLACRGERLIELSCCWFLLKFLSGKLEQFMQFYQVKLMIRGFGVLRILTYSQTLNW